MPTLEDLKVKYGPVLHKIEEQGVKLKNLHLQDNKLFIKGAAPSDAAKNAVWNAIKAVDHTYSDLTADITIDPTLAPPKAAGQTYTVKPGDSLSKISKHFYGDGNKYMKIMEANTDKVKDPDKITPGMVLTIPAA